MFSCDDLSILVNIYVDTEEAIPILLKRILLMKHAHRSTQYKIFHLLSSENTAIMAQRNPIAVHICIPQDLFAKSHHLVGKISSCVTCNFWLNY